jgi:hypothetical protein
MNAPQPVKGSALRGAGEPALFFSGLALLFFFRFFRGDLAFRDPFFEFYPLRLLWEWAREGHYPLWNPYPGLGASLSGSGFPGVWYPLNGPLVFGLGLSPRLAVKVYTWVHYPLAAIGMWVLSLLLGMRREAAAAAAVSYAFSGYLVSMHYAANLLPALALTPLALGLAVRAGRRGTLRGWLGAALITGLIALGGDPQGFALAVGFSALAGFVLDMNWSGVRSPGGRKRFLTLCGSALLYLVMAFAAGAAELMPAWEVLSQSARRQGLDFPSAATWSFHPLRIIEFVCARPFGRFWPLNHYWGDFLQTPPLSFPMAMSPYLGIITVLAAASAWRTQRRPDFRILFFSILGLLSLALALGRYSLLYKWCWQLLPGFALFRFPEKFLLGFTLTSAVMCGLGINAILETPAQDEFSRPRLSIFWPAPLALTIAALVMAAAGIFLPGTLGGVLEPILDSGAGVRVAPARAGADVFFSAARALILFGCGLMILRLARGAAGRPRAYLPALVLFLDLWEGNAYLAPTVPDLYTQHSHWADHIRDRERAAAGEGMAALPGGWPSLGRFRIFRDNDIPLPLELVGRDREGRLEVIQENLLRWQRDTLKPNLSALDGLENFGGINAAADRRLSWFRKSAGRAGLLPVFNVKYAIVEERYADDLEGAEVLGRYQATALAAFKDVFPRAYWVGAAVGAESEEEAVRRLAVLDLHEEVVLGPSGPRSLPAAAAACSA